MPRPARPDDLYRLRVPLEPRLTPDGATLIFSLRTTAQGYDGYRHALWAVPADGSEPARQLTIGAKNDHAPCPSPDGRVVAFLSDRRLAVEDPPVGGPTGPREDGVQIHLLPLGGGEARRLGDLPRGVDGLAWSPDGRRLIALSSSRAAERAQDARRRRLLPAPEPGTAPRSDYRFIDRLRYRYNGRGFIDDRDTHLWLVDAASGATRRLTDGAASEESPTWSPDGRRIAFVADRSPVADIRVRSHIWVVDVESGAVSRVTGGEGAFFGPAWLDDRTIAVLGHRFPARAGSRNDIWLFAADGSESGPSGGRDLSGQHDLMPGSSMNSDIQPSEEPRIVPIDGGASILFGAPSGGSYDLWRIAVDDGQLERLTEGRHYLSGWDAAALPGGGTRLAYLRSSPTEPADAWAVDLSPVGRRGRGDRRSGSPRRLTELNAEVVADLALSTPEERWSTVDGRGIQGWFYPPVDGAAAPPPLVVEIHGGPHTLYGWAPMWEWQVLAGAGMAVFACNPRGSEGYGQEFNAANFRDWGDGPMRDILAGVDALVAEGRVDPGRLGLTGGSYGGYLTNWIVARDHRFRAAVTCRSVSDMTTLMLTGDLQSGDWARLEFGAAPWEDPDLFREISPLTYAARIRTPLLIQHSEEDIRTTIGQAEALFTVLRSLRRPVRFMRVPAESHELTRSGTPFRRVESTVQIREWFRHYLVDGKRGLPPRPKSRAGR